MISIHYDEHPLNIQLISVTLLVLHLEISGKDDNDEHRSHIAHISNIRSIKIR